MSIAGYYLGCPGWSTKTWVGRLFPTATRPTEFLELYARAFNTVEGNTTFYALVLALLAERGVDLVTMDTRGLHSGHTLTLADVRERKPNLPVVARATASLPFVRCVPHEVFDESRRFVEPWARQIADWIGEGKTPYFFMHAPDDTYAPENAYAFHAMVRAHRDVGELPPWPGGPRQLSLL